MFYAVTKRIIDIAGAVVLLVLFSPVMALSAIIIKLTSKGPVFADTPMRVGRYGKKFYAYKFRSMIVNAHTLLRTDPKFKKAYDELQNAGNYKIKNDPRVTPYGRFIRKYSVDEMPQLINVIKGEMSIVGPRPYYEEELARQQKSFNGTEKYVAETLTVRPGITGYWQVSGRSNVKFDKRIKMDAFYAKKRSIFFDAMIMAKTPWVMISGKGAH